MVDTSLSPPSSKSASELPVASRLKSSIEAAPSEGEVNVDGTVVELSWSAVVRDRSVGRLGVERE